MNRFGVKLILSIVSFLAGGVSYVLDKSRLSIRLQPPYSEERRRKASENAKQNGFVSQTE